MQNLLDAAKLFRERESDFFVDVQNGHEIADILEKTANDVEVLNDKIYGLNTINTTLTEENNKLKSDIDKINQKITMFVNAMHIIVEKSEDGEIKDLAQKTLE